MCVHSREGKVELKGHHRSVQSRQIYRKFIVIPNLRMLLVRASNVNTFGKQAEVSSKGVYLAVMHERKIQIITKYTDSRIYVRGDTVFT